MEIITLAFTSKTLHFALEEYAINVAVNIFVRVFFVALGLAALLDFHAISLINAGEVGQVILIFSLNATIAKGSLLPINSEIFIKNMIEKSKFSWRSNQI
jgi:hypothetical protein